MKKRKIRNIVAKSMIGLAFLAGGTAVVSAVQSPVYAWTANATEGNESFGYSLVSCNYNSDSYIDRKVFQSFYDVVGSYSIASKGNYTLKAKVTGRTLYSDNYGNQAYTYLETCEQVYNSAYNYSEGGDDTGHDDNTGIGSGDGWIYAIENQGEIKFVYGRSSDFHEVTFSRPLTSTMFIYVPIKDSYCVYDAYSNESFSYYVAKYAFSVSMDNTAPTVKLIGISSGNELSNGAQVSEKVRVEADDINYSKLYYKTPNSSSYQYTTEKTFTTYDDNGVYSFYAEDELGNQSSVYSVTYDTTAPTGRIVSGGTNVESGSIISKSFIYTATDSITTVAKAYYKSPNMNSFEEYVLGSAIPSDSGDGWYDFYCEDQLGNRSATSRVFLETNASTITIYRNGSVAFSDSITSSKNVDTAIYYNPGDTLRFSYSSSSGVVNSNYSIDEDINTNNIAMGENTLTMTSPTGIVTNYKFYVVEKEPSITINGIEYQSGSVINLNADSEVVFNFDSVTDSSKDLIVINSIGDTLINDNYYLSDKESLNLMTSNNTETTYFVTLRDASGKESSFTVCIDKEKPTGEFEALDGTIITNGTYTNKTVRFNFDEEEIREITYSFNGTEYIAYSGEELSNDGVYNIIAVDKAGNKSTFQIVVDKIPATGEFYADYQKVDAGISTNKKVYFTWTDEATCLVNGIPYTKNTVLTNDGIYKFELTDLAGNKSTFEIEIDTVKPSFNKDAISSEKVLPITKWYRVEYDDNTKSFADYDSALSYARELEMAKYVTRYYLADVTEFNQYHLVATNGNPAEEVKPGYYYRYKSMSNDATELYYFDEELLTEALNSYAKAFISDINYYKLDKDNEYGLFDDNMFDNIFTDVSGVEAPIANQYVFKSTDSIKVTARLVGTDEARDVLFDIPFGEQFSKSGLYLITESDKANNITTYYVYLDKSAPELDVIAEVFGENSSKILHVSKTSIEPISAYYYKSFNIESILDADTWATIAITKNRETKYYSYGDELPSLTEGGKYTISVYDRLDNSYEFNLFIVGNEATVTFAENDDSTSVDLDIKLEQEFDALVSLEVYRNGVKIEGITTENLHYTFNKGGLYVVTLKDNFGRSIEHSYNFIKSLPQGVLTGTNNDGKTKTNVIFEYDNSKYFTEVTRDGILSNDYSGNLIFSNDGIYSIKLINLTDDENYSVYSFEIDNKAPIVFLDGVEANSTSNKNVTVSFFDEDIAKSYYILNGGDPVDFVSGTVFKVEGNYKVVVEDDLGNQTAIDFEIDKSIDYVLYINHMAAYNVDITSQNISLESNEPLTVSVTRDGVAIPYDFGSVLYEEGYYVFYVQDDYGNSVTFAIMIDKSVDIKMNVLDGAISNEDVEIEAAEEVTLISTKDGNPYEYNLGDKFTEEGIYKVIAYDAYSNQKTISFQIVKGTKTALNYSINTDIDIVSIKRNGEDYSWNSNVLNFPDDGNYEITCQAGEDTYSFNLSLDTTAPEITLEGVKEGGKVDGKVVILGMSEEGTMEVYKDGEKINYEIGRELSAYGNYKVVLTDSLGNSRTVTFSIEYQMNGWAIALVVVGVLALGTLVGLVIFNRRKAFKSKK